MVPPEQDGGDRPLTNLPLPTLGGKQFWQDVYVHACWRIQYNVLTGHHRLLDPDDVRRAWGSFAATKAYFETLRRAKGIKPRSRHLVLLVHGIIRSTGTFSRMKARLQEAGYDACAISYPSTRDVIEAHAAAVVRLLERLEDTETVSFVTHSMGGLIIRHVLATEGAWRSRLKLGHVIMIAPPNRGSAVARVLKDFPPYTLLYGKSGQQLVPAAVERMPIPDVPVMIIAGGTGENGLNPFLDGDDDGTVTVAETALGNSLPAVIVRAHHVSIANHEVTIAATKRRLASPVDNPAASRSLGSSASERKGAGP